MKPIDLISHLNNKGVRLVLKGNKLLCDAPKDTINSELLAAIKANIAALMALIVNDKIDHGGADEPEFKIVIRENPHPLSYAQKRMMVLHTMQDDPTAFNLSLAIELKGIVDSLRLEAGLEKVAKRHELLRTCFAWVDDEPVQKIQPITVLNVKKFDLRNAKTAGTYTPIMDIVDKERQRPFDIGRAPLFRVILIRRSEDESVLLLVSHHLVADEASMTIIAKEMSDHYNGISADKSGAGSSIFQYVDYVSWESAFLGSPAGERQLRFWSDRLRQFTICDHKSDHPADRRTRFHESDKVEFELPENLTTVLETLSREHKASLFMVSYAIFTVLIASIYKTFRFCCGTPIVNRARMELEGMIGYFSNTLVLGCVMSDNQAFVDYLGAVRSDVLEAFSHGDIPFEFNLEQAGVAANPLTRWMFTYTEDDLDTVQFNRLAATRLRLNENITQNVVSELSLFVCRVNNRLNCSLLYARDLFELTASNCLIRDFRKIAEAIVRFPRTSIGNLIGKCESSIYRRHRLVEEAAFDLLGTPTSQASSVNLLRTVKDESGFDPQDAIPASSPITSCGCEPKLWLPSNPGEHRRNRKVAFVAPRTSTEKALAEIWCDVLHIRNPGIHDNFFELGGQSMLAMKTIMRAGKIGMSLKPRSFFTHPTIAELAAAVDQTTTRQLVQAESLVSPTGSIPLTPAQIRFLFERETCNPHHWNFSMIVKAHRLIPNAIEMALKGLLTHHDALRLRLSNEAGEWRQTIGEATDDVPFKSYDISGIEPKAQRDYINVACKEFQGSLNLCHGPVLQVAHFCCGPNQPDRLFFTMHHFVIDALSWDVFWEDFESAYNQGLTGGPITFPLKTTSFREWSFRLRNLVASEDVRSAITQWLGLPWHQVGCLPLDYSAAPGANINASADDFELLINAEESNPVVTPGGDCRPEEIMLAALAQALGEWTVAPVALIDCLNHGRMIVEDTDLTRTVGFMLCYQPMVLRIEDGFDLEAIQNTMIDQLRQLPKGYTFDLLRFFSKSQNVKDTFGKLPRAEVLFNFTWDHEDTECQKSSLFARCNDKYGSDYDPQNGRYYPLAINAAIIKNGLRFRFAYSRNLHRRSSIEQLANSFRRYLLNITANSKRAYATIGGSLGTLRETVDDEGEKDGI